MYQQLPVRSDLPAYEFQIELETVTYTFALAWNSRAGLWVMSIGDAAGDDLLNGVALVGGALLLSRYQLPGLPPGDILVLDTTGANANPTVDNLGTDVLLMYRTSDETDEELAG